MGPRNNPPLLRIGELPSAFVDAKQRRCGIPDVRVNTVTIASDAFIAESGAPLILT
jgi:hypothetical protein